MDNSVKNGLKIGVGIVTGVGAYFVCASVLGSLLPDDDGVLGIIEHIGVGGISSWVGGSAASTAMKRVDTIDRLINAIGRSAVQQTT